MRASSVSGASNVSSSGCPRAVSGGRLRMRGGMRGLSVGYFGRVQYILAVGAELNVRRRARVERSLGQAEGGCEDNLERGERICYLLEVGKTTSLLYI